MRLAHGPQNDLTGFRTVLEPHRRVFGDQARQALGELVLIRLAPRHDGDRQQGIGHLPGLHE